jgi:hypothetical protein
MESSKTFWKLPLLCLALGILLPFVNAHSQMPLSDNETTKTISNSAGGSNDFRSESEVPQTKILFALKTDAAGILNRINELGGVAGSANCPAGRIEPGQDNDASSKAGQPNSGRKVKKVPLILGIGGATVMAAGLVFASDSCGEIAPCFRTGGYVAAGVGGAVAVTGFYFAIKR